MKVIQGDLLKLALNGSFDVIIHGCNCFCCQNAGIAKQISRTFPEVLIADKRTKKGDKSKLGSFSFAEVGRNNIKFVVVNLYSQYNYGTDKINADYDALRKGFQAVKKQFSGKRIGYPKISAGLAKGDWNIISNIIDYELENEDHTLVEYRQ